MNNPNRDFTCVQERLQQFFEDIDNHELLSSLLSPSDLQNFIQQGIAKMLASHLQKERDFYLKQNPNDRANGYAPTRTFHFKTMPINIDRPRSRDGFYPNILPKYGRHLSTDYQQLLSNILLEARSFKSALATMKHLNMGYSESELEELLVTLDDEAKKFHHRPLDSDWFFLYADAKVIDLKDDHDTIKKAVHFLVIGVDTQAHKHVLCSSIFFGNEVLDCWKKVIQNLLERGLRRVLLLVTDDFPGLSKIITSLLPHTDHQLCTVHMLRNAKRHLPQHLFEDFVQAWRDMLNASDFDSAKKRFVDLLDKMKPHAPHFAKHLLERNNQLLAFFNYPRALHKHLYSTNLPEGINNLIENLHRNSGGHFHSQREVSIKMKLLIDRLYSSKWKKPNPTFKSKIFDLTLLFKKRFETAY